MKGYVRGLGAASVIEIDALASFWVKLATKKHWKRRARQMAKFTGVCRIKGNEGSPNMVRVTDGDMVFDDVDETGYRFAHYQPPLEELPWCSGYKTDVDKG